MKYDIAIIGAGLLGCFTARNLARHNWRVAVLEKNCDVCTEMSKACTAIIYPGYDPMPGSLKARLNAEAMSEFESLCRSLGVRLRRPGSMMVAFGERGGENIRAKLRQGILNGVPNLRLLETKEILALEPNINDAVKCALFSPDTATVNPWELGIAGAMNAAENGVDFYFNSRVEQIKQSGGGYILKTASGEFPVRAVVNCAGLYGDEVSELINRPRFRILTSAADYMLLDERVGSHVRHIIMHEPEEKSRGATLVPTVDGNILLGPSRINTDSKTGFEATREGQTQVAEVSRFVFPNLPTGDVIRSFATIRPAISIVEPDGSGGVRHTGERISDLLIYETENRGFINLAGIRTPGLTCCDAIGRHVSALLLEILGNPGKNPDFSERVEQKPRFRDTDEEKQRELVRENPEHGKIVCRCRRVTEAELRQSVRRTLGKATLDGVKRRTGAQMGRCQGSFCTQRILEIIADELGIPVSEVCKEERNSELVRRD